MMMKVMKSCLASLLVGSVMISAQAASVGEDMFALQRHLGQVLNATSVPAFEEALGAMKVAALDASEQVPSGMQAGSEQVTQYQAEMKAFVKALDEAKAKAQGDSLEAAKAFARENLLRMKNEGHQRFR